MEQYVIRLIRHDVKISNLINTLEDVNISARYYYSCNSSVVFYLMGIPSTEELTDKYSQLVESAIGEMLIEPNYLEVFSKQVYNDLLKFREL